MDDYIKRADALQAVTDCWEPWFGSKPAGDIVRCPYYAIMKIQSSDVQPVVHGEWVEKPHWVPLPLDCEPSVSLNQDEYDKKTHSEKQMWWHCSCCDYSPYRWEKPIFNFCPNCGAKMDGK